MHQCKKWHEVLGKLCSMVIAIPGARGMFGCHQNALSLKTKSHVSFEKGVHQALEDFRWLAMDLMCHPTCISKLVPLLSATKGKYDALGAGAGGV